MEWSSVAEFEAWLKEEQITKMIEFVLSSTKPGNWLWTQKRTYVCSRQASGGQKNYEKINPDRQYKIDSKKTGCRCQVVIKHFPHTLTILGRYTEEHDHKIQLANVAYTRLSHAASVSAAPAKTRPKPAPQSAKMLAEPSCMSPSWLF
jgi:hypothetical protein